MNLSESEIQGLKSQEAKDLCIDLLNQLQAKEKAPISPGEVQMKELEYELKLKEAETEDNRRHEEHLLKIKELELQIEAERTRQSEAERQAEQVRQEHAQMVEQVESAQESLSVQFERATREHALKLERLEAEFKAKNEELQRACDELEKKRNLLSEEITELSGLAETASEIGRLREELATRQSNAQRELQELEEELESSEFDKKKRIKDLRRQQELDIAELEANHKKHVIEMNRKAADELFGTLDLVGVEKSKWEQYQQASANSNGFSEEDVAKFRGEGREELRREYNITLPDVFDVTELYYNHKSTVSDADSLRKQIEKQESEIRRMREHIEKEPTRIAAAVEAAKVQIQNNIEQASSR